MSFWLPSYREFKKFVGQLTAAAAAVEVSVRHTVQLADRVGGDSDLWRQLAMEVGIQLNGMTSREVRVAASRLQLVAAYSGFDAFLRGLRTDWRQLHQADWQRFDKDTPFDEVRRNVKATGLNLEPEATAIDYYRRCRNWIVHPDKSTEQAASDLFTEQGSNLEQVRLKWQKVGQLAAPSPPTELSFHDVKLLARVSLHVAELISLACDPGDDMLQRLVPLANWSRLVHDPAGRQRAIAGYLQTMFGLDRDRADRIALRIVEAT